MILAFDMDDTLYPEITFVHSGVRAVASYLQCHHGLDTEASYGHMLQTLEAQGRGEVFDALLRHQGLYSRTLVQRCLSVYRTHVPDIALYPETRSVLQALRCYPHYLVTDGNKQVQARKVEALELEPLFRRVFITHRFGVAHAKPSTYCFSRILEAESAPWSELVYVGDNPAKDFVNLNKQGAHTVRVLTGGFASTKAKPGFDAQHVISGLKALPALIEQLAGKHT